jgi:hypothetical protein
MALGSLHRAEAVPEYDRRVTGAGRHTLVVYRASERADSTLVEVVEQSRHRGDLVTVLALAVEEPTGQGCCDTRSVLWNNYAREFAENDLARARVAVGDAADVEFAVLVHNGRRVADAVVREAGRRGADEIVVADCLTRRERRRLHLHAAVPVTA